MRRRDVLALAALGGAALAVPALFSRRTLAPGRAPPRELDHVAHAGLRVLAGELACDLDTHGNRVVVAGSGAAARALENVAAPVSLARRGDELHVVEWGARRVGVFDLEGRRRASFGGVGELRAPRDAAWRGDELVVADAFDHRLRFFDAGGRPGAGLGRFGTGEGQLNGPASVAVDARGDLWVADSGNARVQVFTASGRFVGAIGGRGRGDGQFLAPRCVRIDEAGDVHVADPIAGVVHVFDGEGRFRQRLAPEGGVPAWLSPRPGGGMLVSVRPGRPA